MKRTPVRPGQPPVRRARLARSRKRIRSRYVTKGGRNSDPAKLEWQRGQPCILARWDGAYCEGVTETHHERRYGARATDRRTLRLCATGHHREGPHSRHVLGPEGFEAFHGLSIEDEIAKDETRWQAERVA